MCNNVNKCQNNYTEFKNPDIKRQTCYIIPFIKTPEKAE